MWPGMFQDKAVTCGSMRTDIKIAMVVVVFKSVGIPKQGISTKFGHTNARPQIYRLLLLNTSRYFLAGHSIRYTASGPFLAEIS
jgi:hypothetical protein